MDTLVMAASDWFSPFKRYDDEVYRYRAEPVLHPAMKEQRKAFASLMKLWRTS